MDDMRIIFKEEQLKKIIEEELGISETVNNTALSILAKIKNILVKHEPIEKQEGVIIHKDGFDFEFMDNKISLTFNFYNFLSKEYANYVLKREEIKDCWSVYIGRKTFLMSISFYGISGQINESQALNGISHELEHIYQQILGSGLDNNEIYAQIKTDMYSPSEVRSQVGRLMYGLLKSEQEAYVNGLYSYAMSVPVPYSQELLESNECWEIYVECKTIIDHNEDNQEFWSLLKTYKETPKTIERKMNQFIHRIGRVITKIQKDKYLQGWKN